MYVDSLIIIARTSEVMEAVQQSLEIQIKDMGTLLHYCLE